MNFPIRLKIAIRLIDPSRDFPHEVILRRDVDLPFVPFVGLVVMPKEEIFGLLKIKEIAWVECNDEPPFLSCECECESSIQPDEMQYAIAAGWTKDVRLPTT